MNQPFASRRNFLFGSAALTAAASAAPISRTAASRRALLDPSELGLRPGMIHLNTASAGPTPNSVLARTVVAWHRLETDPVLMTYGKDPASVVSAADEVRSKIGALVGCSNDEILLTHGTTDGITTLAQSIKLREGDRVLLTDQEHEGGETGWLHRQRIDGIIVDRVNIPIGDYDVAAIIDRFKAAIGPRTRAISVSHVLSPTGLRMPVAEIAALARSRGILCIVDGAQAVGQIAVDVKSLGCDAYAASGHKWLMGPKGTGFIYISKRAAEAIQPPQWLNGRDFGSNSAGVGAITLAIGLGEAVDRIAAIGVERIEAHNLPLRDGIYRQWQGIPQLRLVSPPPGELATALIAAGLPSSIDSESLIRRMHDRHRVIIKKAEKRWLNGIRFSPHIFNDQAQIDFAMAALRTELRASS